MTANGSDLNMYYSRNWKEPQAVIKAYESEEVNVAKFAASGRFIVTGGEDRSMKVFRL